ncbi:MAG: chorismate-binding protein, partial [Halobacteriota archaeon]
MSAYFDLARAEFEDVAEPGCVVALHRELDVDLAPLDAYTALRDGHAFLLESAEKHVSAFREVDGDGGAGDRARYSFVGFEPDAVVEIDGRAVDVERLRDDAAATLRSRRTETAEADDALDGLRGALPDVEPRNFRSEGRQVFTGGLVGVLGYDVVHDVWLDGAGSRSTAPDAVYVVSTRNLTFDHDADAVTLVFTPVVDGETDPLEVYDACVEAGRRAEDRLEAYDGRSSQPFVVHDETAGDRESYVDAVETARDHVYDGDVYQAVVSRKRTYDVEGDPRDYYEALREVNPSPYMYLLEYGDHAVVGSSPETLVSV